MQKINVKKLAEMVVRAPLSDEERGEILENIKYLPDERVDELYVSLKALIRAGAEAEARSKRVDLKYGVRVEEEVKKERSK